MHKSVRRMCQEPRLMINNSVQIDGKMLREQNHIPMRICMPSRGIFLFSPAAKGAFSEEKSVM